MRKNFIHHTIVAVLILAVISVVAGCTTSDSFAQCNQQWKIHDRSRPHPRIVDPGTASTQNQPGQPPSDAIILFDGKGLSQWRSMDGSPAKWKIKDGYIETVGGAGYIRTVQKFGDCQLHVEWTAPLPVKGNGQGRGNSGVFLMGKYEVQVLDSYQNKTYADGQAAAVYGQYPPQVNACRPPGQWQTYDIIFHRPRFDETGELLRPARMTVLHNGVLVQDNVELLGPTRWVHRPSYQLHPDKLPLSLQDHGNPVRYRNIWIRELPEPGQSVQMTEKEITLPTEILDRYVGRYQVHPSNAITITRHENQMFAQFIGFPKDRIFAQSKTKFFMKHVDVQIVFNKDKKGVVESLTFEQGEGKTVYKKIK